MFSKALSLGFGLLAFSGSAFASNGKLIAAPVEKVFIPVGFDDNDDIEIVVNGTFKDTCFKVGPSSVKVDKEAMTVTVSAHAYEYENAICAQMLVPFVQPVKVGSLAAGTYKVIIANSSAALTQELVVKPRVTESPDDFIYAPVESAEIIFSAGSGNQSLTVSGNYPRTFVGCAIITKVEMKKTGDVLVVLPIMELLTDGAECAVRGWTPQFNLVLPVTSPLDAGTNLLHVRVTNGNSYNKLVQFAD